MRRVLKQNIRIILIGLEDLLFNFTDIIALQQLMWEIKPDLVIETGIARGGSLIFISSMLELLSICGSEKKAKVVGIDIDIRKHNEIKIKKTPFIKKNPLIERILALIEKFLIKLKKFQKSQKNYGHFR